MVPRRSQGLRRTGSAPGGGSAASAGSGARVVALGSLHQKACESNASLAAALERNHQVRV